MRTLTWLYFAVALGLLVWLGRLVLQSAGADPRTLYEAGVRRSSGPELDTRRALSDFELALSGAEAAHDDALIEQVLLARARLLTSSGGLTQARADLERVLTYYRPGSAAIEARLADIALKSGDAEDARTRAEAVIARAPEEATAWNVRARALLALADGHLKTATRAAGTSLADEGYAHGQELMRRIAALERSDPNRARLVQALIDTAPSGNQARAAEVLDHLDLASDVLSQVPPSLAHSFRGVLDREVMRDYLKLLRDSGRDSAAVDFGLAVRGSGGIRDWPPFLTVLMRALLARGRPELAVELISPSVGRTAAPDADFYITWCLALYRAQRWKALAGVAHLVRVSGEPEDRASANFFLGIAQTRMQQYDEAAVTLTRYTQHPDGKPVPGAVALAWQAIAEGYRTRGKGEEERITLEQRLRLGPDRYDGVGEAWQRLSELYLEARPPNRGLGFEALTQALRLLPRRRAELEPVWRQVGQQLLDAAQIDVHAERERLDRANAALPLDCTNSLQILAHAELLMQSGNYAGAVLACWRLLELYPDFLPAIDLYADATAKTGEYAAAARWLQRHVELAGLDAATLARMTALPRDKLGPEWMLELVRLDPEHIGRRAAADSLREQGRTAEALFHLELIRGDELGDDGCLLAASLAYELGHYERAQDLLARLSPSIEVLARALPLALDLGAQSRDPKHVANLMRLLELKVEPDVERLLACADHMLLAGMPTSAIELCSRLDARPRWRSSSVFVRLAQGSMLLGDVTAASEHLERAGAFDDSGLAEIGRLVRAVDDRAWSVVPTRVAELRDTTFKPSAPQAAALDALSEHLLEARERIKNGRENQPDEPAWLLLEAAVAALAGEASPDFELGPEAPSLYVFGVTPQGAPAHDPRPLLARLVALGHPQWSAWAIADLEHAAPPRPGALWPNYLAGIGYQKLQRYDDAARCAKASIAAWPTFAPAWDLIAEAMGAELRRPDHPKLLKLAQERQTVLGVSPAERADSLIAQARIQDEQGQTAAALRSIEAALVIDPERGAARRKLAQILRHRGEWKAAIEAFHEALGDAPTSTDSHPVAEFLELLKEAAVAEPALAADGTCEREIEFLSGRFDRDPLVALARAERALPPEKLADRSAQALAVDRLADFRKHTEGAAIDQLRPATSREWVDFLARFDRDRAREFVKRELALQPGSIDLWRMLGFTAADVGELDEAIAAFEVAQRMLPDGASGRRLAELYGERGDDVARVRTAVADAGRLERVGADDPRLQWTLARALVHGSAAELEEGLGLLARLWGARDPKQPEAVGRVGDTYGVALLRRSRADDRRVAQTVLSEAAPYVADPSRRVLIESLASLATILD